MQACIYTSMRLLFTRNCSMAHPRFEGQSPVPGTPSVVFHGCTFHLLLLGEANSGQQLPMGFFCRSSGVTSYLWQCCTYGRWGIAGPLQRLMACPSPVWKRRCYGGRHLSCLRQSRICWWCLAWDWITDVCHHQHGRVADSFGQGLQWKFWKRKYVWYRYQVEYSTKVPDTTPWMYQTKVPDNL